MPRELVALAPRQPVLREYAEQTVGPGEVRIQTEFGAPKHGTEMRVYKGEAPTNYAQYDPEWRCYLPRDSASSRFPTRLGNMCVGTVTDVGAGVSRCAVGDRVFGHLQLREVHVVPETLVRVVPPGLSDEAVVCLDPADAALAMRDAHVRVGDRTAVFGLGAIGLFVVQYCRLSGASVVVAIDPVERRRDLAQRFGASAVLDPTSGDAGLAIRRLTERIGVDVALEVSGTATALHHAIRGTRYGGKVGVISALHNALGLRLDEEFHANRIELISARTVSEPFPELSGWGHQRVEALVTDWLSHGQLSAEGIVDPIVPFDDCAEAYQRIEAHPEESVKLGVRFASGSR